jgi:predicted RNA-binding Zn-ribbon protein involved in translation (DUF1610 family)
MKIFLEQAEHFPRSWVFKCTSCQSSMMVRRSGTGPPTFPCPLCHTLMLLHEEASLIYQRKEAEAN